MSEDTDDGDDWWWDRAMADIRRTAVPSYSPLLNLFRQPGPSAAEQRATEERDRREWIESIRRRLGLVTEVHRCHVIKGNPEWIWSCLRDGCNAAGYFCPSQADASARALAHARSFVPQPPEPEPWTELDVLAFEAAWDAVQDDQARFAAALPDRIEMVTEQVNEAFSGLLPEGMRFEWQ